MQKAEVVVNARAALGEGPVWDETAGYLYFVDILGHTICRLHPGDGKVESVDTGESVGFIVLTTNGGIVAGLESGFYLIDFLTGVKQFIAAPPECGHGWRMNDGKCDAAGRIWAGTLSTTWNHGRGDTSITGSLYRLEAGYNLFAMRSGITLPNGLGFSPDNKTFYFTDTWSRVVTAYDFDLDTGDISDGRPAVTIPEGMGLPDGLAVDAEGMLWICLYGDSSVVRFDPVAGKELDRVNLPVERVTCCAFGGSGLDELYITTAREGVIDLEAQPEAGALFCARPGVTGMKTYRFKD